MSEFVYLIKSLINQHDQFQKAVKARMPDEEAASNVDSDVGRNDENGRRDIQGDTDSANVDDDNDNARDDNVNDDDDYNDVDDDDDDDDNENGRDWNHVDRSDDEDDDTCLLLSRC